MISSRRQTHDIPVPQLGHRGNTAAAPGLAPPGAGTGPEGGA